MSNPRFRQRLRAGESLAGLITNFNSSDVLEFLGGMDLDYLIIDGEHGAFGIEGIARMVRAARAVDIPTIVRVPECNPKIILQTCDAGADGVMIPVVERPEVARQLYEAICYPPLGSRGIHGGTPAAKWGRTDLLEHIELENSGICRIVQIETVAGVGAAREILATPELDAVIVGPTDLSLSMGYPGEINHDSVWEAIEQVFGVAQEYGVACGSLGDTDEQVRRLRSAGASIVLGGLASCLAEGVAAFLSRADSVAPSSV